MPKAVIMIGCSGSGKTRRAQEYVEQGYVKLERDELRLAHIGVPPGVNLWSVWKKNNTNESAIQKAWEGRFTVLTTTQRDIVFSDHNLEQPYRDELVARLKDVGYTVSVDVVGQDLGLDELWKRDEQRLHTVGRAVIAQQYQMFREMFPRYQLRDTTDKPKAVIFDIDGTLAHWEGIRYPYDYEKVDQDAADAVVWAALIGQVLLDRQIIVMSGRDSCCRKLTTEWLEKYYYLTISIMSLDQRAGLDFDSRVQIHMRPEGDQRPDVEIKHELFMEHVDGRYDIQAVFDDRPKVCRGWYDLGLKVIHCKNPYVEF